MNEELKIIISAQIDKLKQNVDKAKNEVKSFKEQVAKASKEVDTNFKSIGTAMANGARAAATGLAAAGTALLALGASTAEYRAEQAKLQTAFEAAGGSAEEAKNTYNDLYRVLGDSGQAVEAANHLAKLTTEEKALSEWTTICQGVYATFGASLPIEGLTEAANETAKTGALTGSLADALNWAGVSEEAFTAKLEACNTEAEREALIRSTLSGLYTDAAAKYEENNAQVLAQNEAQAKLQATLATLGEIVAPLITAFTSFANDALAAVLPHIKSLAETYVPKLEEMLNKLSTALKSAFDWISKNKTILAVMAGIIGGIATAIGLYNAVAAVKAAMDVAQVATLGALVTAYMAQAAAMAVAIAPYALIVAAIAAVIAIIVTCIKHWDKIKSTVVNAGSAIKNAVSSAFESVGNKISDSMDKARDKVKSAIDKIKGFFNFSWSLPKLKLPSIDIKGKFSLNPISVPKFSISWNKLGGVFDKPTLFNYGGSIQGIGEDGAEAVVPLERNTEWMNKLAAMLSERMGSGQDIILQVDGKTFAQISVDSINDLTKQRGSIPLRLV